MVLTIVVFKNTGGGYFQKKNIIKKRAIRVDLSKSLYLEPTLPCQPQGIFKEYCLVSLVISRTQTGYIA